MPVTARLEQEGLDPSAELAAITGRAAGAGAIVSFVGIARPSSAGGEPLQALTLQHHTNLTQQSIDEIAQAAAARFEITHVHVVHRFGTVAPGEPIVFAAAAAEHRRAAFDAADYLMDRLKTDAIFWKREDEAQSSHWVEPTEADALSRGRWD